MKVAISASYFNCPPVAELLKTCDVIYTTNPHAHKTFDHPNIVLCERGPIFAPEDANDVITFSHLFDLFNSWVANEATDKELEEWLTYFGVNSAGELREKHCKQWGSRYYHA